MPASEENDHTKGAMIALVPAAKDAERLAIDGGEPAEQLHCTLLFLGDDASAYDKEARKAITEAADEFATMLGPIEAKIFGAAHWNGDGDKSSWVWSVGDTGEGESSDYGEGLQSAMSLAADVMLQSGVYQEMPVQHSPWVAHICAVYSDDATLLPELEKRLGPLVFDRLRISFGNEDHDVLLESSSQAVSAGGALRRAPTVNEIACRVDFNAVHRAWESATDTAVSALTDAVGGWKRAIHAQIVKDLSSGRPEALTDLTLSTTHAAMELERLMVGHAQRCGTEMQREAERQGVKVPKWSLPDDAMTASVGGRRLLSVVAHLTSDLVAAGVLQSAKRKLTGLLSISDSPQHIAAEVDKDLASSEDTGVRSAVGSAMTAAQNVGRRAVLEVTEPARYYASEILDKKTCDPCKDADGEEFISLEVAIKAYPVMGYKDCVGARHGNSCRGMIIASWSDSGTASASGYSDGSEDNGMPWHVAKSSECESDKPWAVIKDADDSVVGCHETEESANEQVAALYAEEKASGGKESTANTSTLADKKQCPPGMVLDEDTGECVKSSESMAARQEPDPAIAMEKGKTAPWRGPLAIEGADTGDGRQFDVGSLFWSEDIKPGEMPLRWNKEDSHGGEPRTLAVNVGRIDRVWREEETGMIMGEGLLNLAVEDGRTAHGMVKDGFLRGVSVDVDSVKRADMELIWPETDPKSGSEETDVFDQIFAEPEKVIYHNGRIRAATLVDIPAFVEAYIELLDENGEVLSRSEPEESLVSSAKTRTRSHPAMSRLWTPPAAWFRNPELSFYSGIVVTDQGRVYGHAAPWNSCHIGIDGSCVQAPHESEHPYYMTGETVCDDGSRVAVGQITVGTGHAPLTWSMKDAVEHYDNTGTVVADVAVGNDAHGIWVAGAVREKADPLSVYELRASGRVSGDWRRVGGKLRLVGLLGVNVAGFLEEDKMRTLVSSGNTQALVAAGSPREQWSTSQQSIEQWAMRVVMGMLRRRVHPEA